MGMFSREGLAAHPSARFALSYFLLFSVFAVITPYYQALLRARGFSIAEVGYILGAFEFTGIFAPLLWGWFSDRLGYGRGLVALAALSAAVVFLGFGSIRSANAAAILALAFGFFYRPIIPLTDGIRLRYMARNGGDYGPIRCAGSLGFLLTVPLLEAIGVSGANAVPVILCAMAVWSILHACSALALPQTPPHAPSPESGRRFSWTLPGGSTFLILLIIVFFARFGLIGYYSFFTLYLREEFGCDSPGFLWMIGPLAEIPLLFFSDAIIRRIGARALFALGVAGIATRLLGYAFAPSIAWIIPLQALHALTFAATHTSTLHYVHRLAPPRLKQTANTLLTTFAIGLPAVCASALGGWLIERHGFRFMYGTYGTIALAALAALLLFLPKPPNMPNDTPESE